MKCKFLHLQTFFFKSHSNFRQVCNCFVYEYFSNPTIVFNGYITPNFNDIDRGCVGESVQGRGKVRFGVFPAEGGGGKNGKL